MRRFNLSLCKLMLLHMGLMIVVVGCILMLFFQYVLPMITHHGQSITVPNLKGMSLEDADVCLTRRNLLFEITEETSYAPDYPPMCVLQQHPKAGTQVKEKRKIYLTLNTQTPPKVKMPHLVDGSIRNAYLCLKSQGLLLGTVQYIPDIAQMAVLKQLYQGQEIMAGTLVEKGAKIDLVVGAGLGEKLVDVPLIVGMQLTDARLLLLSMGIQIGNVMYQNRLQQVSGTISQQYPGAGEKVRVGEHIDIWLVDLPEEHIVSHIPMLSDPLTN